MKSVTVLSPVRLEICGGREEKEQTPTEQSGGCWHMLGAFIFMTSLHPPHVLHPVFQHSRGTSEEAGVPCVIELLRTEPAHSSLQVNAGLTE